MLRTAGKGTRRQRVRALALLCGWSGAALSWADAPSFSAFAEAEIQLFPSAPAFQGQASAFASLAAQPELYWRSADGRHSAEGKLFYRQTSADDGNRSHGDIRELYYSFNAAQWQIEVGINKVFWGVTESVHLVDIINQTDNVESVSGEEKLGQPMLALGLERGWGNVDLYVLPYFRERAFNSGNERYQFGNPRTDSLIAWNSGGTRWESSKEARHTDFALRWAHYFGALDLGVSYFRGTNRDPIPIFSEGLLAQTPGGVLVPFVTSLASYYEQLDQIGLELQYLYGNWAGKFEGTHRGLISGDYSSIAAGFEYTFSNLGPWGQDVGLLVEYLWNDRKDVDTKPLIDPVNTLTGGASSYFVLPGEYLSPFEDDLFVASRFALNDINSTEFLAGIIYDLTSGTTLASFEGSTRLGDSIRIGVNAYWFSNVASDSSFFFYRNDDIIEAKIAWYF